MFESLGVINYYNFIIATIAIILLPGPNSMYVLSLAGKSGVKAGYKAALGIFLGDSIIMLITALGAASLLKSNPILFELFKFAGGFYLGYLGLQMIIGVFISYKKSKYKNISSQKSISNPETEMTNYKSSYFRSALYISLINPKAILFFLAFFVQFINPSVQIWKPFTVLGITLQFISFCYLTIIIFTGKYLAVYFKKHIVLNYIGNLCVGILFMFFAYKLFISSI